MTQEQEQQEQQQEHDYDRIQRNLEPKQAEDLPAEIAKEHLQIARSVTDSPNGDGSGSLIGGARLDQDEQELAGGGEGEGEGEGEEEAMADEQVRNVIID